VWNLENDHLQLLKTLRNSQLHFFRLKQYYFVCLNFIFSLILSTCVVSSFSVFAIDYLQNLNIILFFQQISKNIKYEQKYWETRQLLSKSILGEGELPRLISEIVNFRDD